MCFVFTHRKKNFSFAHIFSVSIEANTNVNQFWRYFDMKCACTSCEKYFLWNLGHKSTEFKQYYVENRNCSVSSIYQVSNQSRCRATYTCRTTSVPRKDGILCSQPSSIWFPYVHATYTCHFHCGLPPVNFHSIWILLFDCVCSSFVSSTDSTSIIFGRCAYLSILLL